MKVRQGFVTNSSSTCYTILALNDDIKGLVGEVSMNAGEFEDSIKDALVDFLHGHYTESNNDNVEHYTYHDFIQNLKDSIAYSSPITSYKKWANTNDDWYKKERATWPSDKELFEIDTKYSIWGNKIADALNKETVDFNDIIKLTYEADKATAWAQHMDGYSNIRDAIDDFGGVDYCNLWSMDELEVYKVNVDYGNILMTQAMDKLSSEPITKGKVINFGKE